MWMTVVVAVAVVVVVMDNLVECREEEARPS